MRIYFINTASKEDVVKAFEILPSLQFAWWVSGFNIGLFWLNFGIQIGGGKEFAESQKEMNNGEGI